MKKNDKIFVKVLATIAFILVALIVVYFITVPSAFDGTWEHTYLVVSIFFFSVIGFIGFFIQKGKTCIGDALGYGRCPNCNDTWYKNESGSIIYKGNCSSSSGVLLCRKCLDNPKILDIEIISKNLKKCQRNEGDIQFVREAVIKYKNGDKNLRH